MKKERNKADSYGAQGNYRRAPSRIMVISVLISTKKTRFLPLMADKRARTSFLALPLRMRGASRSKKREKLTKPSKNGRPANRMLPGTSSAQRIEVTSKG